MKNSKPYIPIIIIGAARSGTKLLRDTLATHPDIASVPFDINFVWKYGNENINHDQLKPQLANSKIINFIRNYLRKYAGNSTFLIEKTVSNTLRIPFVETVLPNSKYIHLVRDGKDVVESVYRQWGTLPTKNYLFAKLKSFPVFEGFVYGIRYALDLAIIMVRGKNKENYVWGVKYPGFEKDLKKGNTISFCAEQWAHCVQTSLDDLENIPSHRQITIRYEDLVNNPYQEIRIISDFLKLNNYEIIDISNIRKDSIGKGRNNLTFSDWNELMPIISSTLIKLRYSDKIPNNE